MIDLQATFAVALARDRIRDARRAARYESSLTPADRMELARMEMRSADTRHNLGLGSAADAIKATCDVVRVTS